MSARVVVNSFFHFHPSSITIRSCISVVHCRLFSSEGHLNNNENNSNKPNVREEILRKSLPHVHTLGWTRQALVQGAKDYGYPPTAHGLFPREGADLALYFYEKSNKALSNQLTTEIEARKLINETKPVKVFIRDAIQERIRMTTPYQRTWPQAMAQLAQPSAAVDAMTLLGQLVDEIWHLAGDKSHDISWYTKRASLAYIYKTTEVYMLQDKSEDFEDTWKFLDRRFDDVAGVGGALSFSQDMFQVLLSGSSSAFTVLRNITGMNKR